MAHRGFCAGQLPHHAPLHGQYGVRWDIDTPPVDAHNRTASFVPGQQSTVISGARRRAMCSWGTKVSVAASSSTQLPIFRLVLVLHGIRLGMAKPRFAPQRASSSALPAAMSGTSPATPCRSPFATALATTPSLTNIYDGRFPKHSSGWRHLPVHLYAVGSGILSEPIH